MTYEPCGLCGCAEGVRFPIPGREVDAVLCRGCVRSAVTAHAEAGSAEWAKLRRTVEAEKQFFAPAPREPAK